MPCSCVQWRRWIRPLVLLLYVVLLLAVVPLCVWEGKAWFIAGIFVFLTIPISLWDILQHLVHYTQPELMSSCWSRQAVLIAFLVKVGVISEKRTWDWASVEAVATGLQDFIICIEMFLAAIAHHYTFTHKPYIQEAEEGTCLDSFLAMWDFSDIRADVTEQVRHVGRTFVGRPNKMYFGAAARPEHSEHTGLLSQDAAPASVPTSPSSTGRYQGLGHTVAPHSVSAPAGFTAASWAEDDDGDAH